MFERYKVLGSLILSMICWAFSFVWIKQAFISFNPLTIVVMRLVISAGLLAIILKLLGQLVSMRKADLKWFLLLAFFEPFLYFMGESFGLELVSSTVGAVIVSTIPLFAPITDRLFFKSRISWANILGIIVSFAGVLLLIFKGDFSLAAPLKGIMLVFLAVFAALGYSVVLKKVPGNYNAVSIITYQNAIGLLYFLPLFLIYDLPVLDAKPLTMESIYAVVMLAVVASSLAFIFFTHGMRIIGITKANVFVNMIPVFTAILAWIILGEVITFQMMIGILLVIGGVFVSQLKLRRRGF
ncbi:DMT family transporter [Carboxylicivirga sediminis]|uniref:DMT family transporter n=1 Tax=Carboxylicivirga sediminis TaxID=2006564 RepID=A0A941F6I0_9BACT|nr:DMT family transporter [Carboxylicivirga sediminis]MBR8536858.1 DMT family transporter [Carboxylicivirga sediminis]